jgi:hypothetical protein
MTTESENQTYGEASVQAEQGFAPMSDAYAAPEEKRKTYSAEEGGIREAAEDLFRPTRLSAWRGPATTSPGSELPRPPPKIPTTRPSWLWSLTM